MRSQTWEAGLRFVKRISFWLLLLHIVWNWLINFTWRIPSKWYCYRCFPCPIFVNQISLTSKVEIASRKALKARNAIAIAMFTPQFAQSHVVFPIPLDLNPWLGLKSALWPLFARSFRFENQRTRLSPVLWFLLQYKITRVFYTCACFVVIVFILAGKGVALVLWNSRSRSDAHDDSFPFRSSE